MVEQVVLRLLAPPLIRVHRGAVSGAAPGVVGPNERVRRALLPRPQQPLRARDPFGIFALPPAATVAGVEQVEAQDAVIARVPQNVRPFDDALLPRLVVADQLVRLTIQP